jgi:hypothetical protein
MRSGRVIYRGWRPTGILDYWNPDKPYDPDTARRVREYVAGLPAEITHLFEEASYPYHQPRNALRRPDLLGLRKMLPGDVEMLPLVIFRDPVLCVGSALRRRFARDTMQQAYIIEDNLIHITSQVRFFDFRVLDFTGFIKDPAACIPALSRWAGIPADLLEQGVANLRTPATTKNAIPRHDELTAFFDADRCVQWEPLGRPNVSLL